ncbi:MAG: sugar ABC transporter permease [Lachnospiraceae bacterium]|nr:sugar ABC transporter permease [Lachnospiraceae bacterium]
MNKSLAGRRKRQIATCAFVFLLPVLVFMIAYLVWPIIATFVNSFYQWNGISADKKFIGFYNWNKLMHDVDFWRAFGNNIKVMVISLVVQMPVGILLATFLDAGGKKFDIFKSVWFLPMLMSAVAVGYLFRYALATNGGLISSISQLFGGGPVDLLGNQATALYAVIGVICWQFIPFYMVYYMAGYASISEDVYEAAIMDGATHSQYIFKIALPLLVPTIKSAIILSLIGSLKYFDLVYVMTGGGPGTSTELMATYMYKNSFVTFNMGYGSAIAGGMFILITLIAAIAMKILNGKETA